jgi:hypothetical protein
LPTKKVETFIAIDKDDEGKPEQPVVLMEYVPTSLTNGFHLLTVPDIARLAAQMKEAQQALAAAHEVYHNDPHVRNVLFRLKADGSVGDFVLADFGKTTKSRASAAAGSSFFRRPIGPPAGDPLKEWMRTFFKSFANYAEKWLATNPAALPDPPPNSFLRRLNAKTVPQQIFSVAGVD